MDIAAIQRPENLSNVNVTNAPIRDKVCPQFIKLIFWNVSIYKRIVVT